ncbi:MAG TPA: response regulator [Chloroflexi bacterium]|nr:response regulator [Chloroflexota bacterium]
MSKATAAGSARILVVDDDEKLLELLRMTLQRAGVELVAVADGVRGMEALQSERFDLLILDLMLPDIDGLEMLRQVRQDPRFDKMPVLILSALAVRDIIRQGLELGADGYLTKPYLPDTLIGCVRNLLAEGRRRPGQPSGCAG